MRASCCRRVAFWCQSGRFGAAPGGIAAAPLEALCVFPAGHPDQARQARLRRHAERGRSTAVIPFTFGSSAIRTVVKDGEPWFVGRDVALVLGYAKPENAIREHCKGGTGTVTPSAGGPQRTKIIPERDVYRLIMRSKLPAAEQFEEWVVGTVLPSLRKHEGYVVGQEAMTKEEYLAKAVLVAQSVIAETDGAGAAWLLEPL